MEFLTWLAGSMTLLEGSPPPGVQSDIVEGQLQELEVRDCWECCVWIKVNCAVSYYLQPHPKPAYYIAKQP